MKITDLLNKENIIFELKARSKEDIINELSENLINNKQIKNFKKMKNAIFEREKVLSTGIGKGVAIPHCRTEAVGSIVIAFGKTEIPIDFGSLDGKPVQIVFLFASNEGLNSEHLKLLNQIGRLASNDGPLNRILNSKNSDEIYNILKEFDKAN